MPALSRISLVVLALLLGTVVAARAEPAAEIAPSGKLRVAVIAGNPVLASKRPDGTLGGFSVELGRFIAKKLGATFDPVPYANPAAYAKSFGTGAWDLAIGPHTPIADQYCDISPDLMLVDNIYLAAPGKEFTDAAQVDRPGVKIAVAANGAPDQYLSKALKAAALVRIVGDKEILEALRTGKADAYGSNAEYVDAAAKALPGAKIVPGAFRTVHMAVAMPKGRSAAARQQLAAIVNEAKAGGLVQKVIAEQGLKGVRVAP